jgi:CDGSH-type Zn-finger protein
LAPTIFIAEKSETVWLCGCKRTMQPPFCDGSHETL